jgi:hypothetical protein
MDERRVGQPSASNWRRYELCPGSYQLGEKAEQLGQAVKKSSPAASRGERIHAYLAGEKVQLSSDELTTAQFLAERADAEVKRIFGDQPVTILKEKRLWLRPKG